MLHELKTDPELFQAVLAKKKTYEIRKDDLGFKDGDELWLYETKHTGKDMRLGKPLEYTGKVIPVKVMHILRGPIYGLKDGWVIMSITDDFE